MILVERSVTLLLLFDGQSWNWLSVSRITFSYDNGDLHLIIFILHMTSKGVKMGL
jgi:hypothetical protein